jgi:hypothetical protein
MAEAWSDARFDAQNGMASDWGSGVAAKGTAVMKSLLGGAAMSNPYTAAAAVAMEAVKTGNNSAANSQFKTTYDHSGWNVNFGSGSITSSADRAAAAGQWLNILAGVAALLVAYKTLRG